MYNLSNEEKSYLRKIVESTRKDYINKNKYCVLEDDIDSINEKFLVSIENIEVNFEIKCEKEISPSKIEDVFWDKNMNKIVKALTLREKLVLFSYYFESKTDSQIAEVLNKNPDTIRKIRGRALKKIKEQYLKVKGDDLNV